MNTVWWDDGIVVVVVLLLFMLKSRAQKVLLLRVASRQVQCDCGLYLSL
jgi:hypothetical protein